MIVTFSSVLDQRFACRLYGIHPTQVLVVDQPAYRPSLHTGEMDHRAVASQVRGESFVCGALYIYMHVAVVSCLILYSFSVCAWGIRRVWVTYYFIYIFALLSTYLFYIHKYVFNIINYFVQTAVLLLFTILVGFFIWLPSAILVVFMFSCIQCFHESYTVM